MSAPSGPVKNVIYKSTGRLDCSCTGEVIVCVDPSLTYNGAPFIEGTLVQISCGRDICNRSLYSYYINYSSGYLADPDYSLVSADILGLVCRGCLTKYIDFKTPFVYGGSPGDGYTYVMPADAPFPGQSLQIASIDGDTVYLEWV